MTAVSEQKPHLEIAERCSISTIFENGYQIIIRHGYLQQPDIPKVLTDLKNQNPDFEKILDLEKISFILGRETIFATQRRGMALWREKIFVVQAKNEMPATQYFQLPSERVVEVGTQIAL